MQVQKTETCGSEYARRSMSNCRFPNDMTPTQGAPCLRHLPESEFGIKREPHVPTAARPFVKLEDAAPMPLFRDREKPGWTSRPSHPQCRATRDRAGRSACG